MTESPLVSVVMPVYNAEQYLADAIQSILMQRYKNIEIIIIDDGSMDSSLSIIEHFQKIDARIQVIRQTTNQGLVSALNRGFEVAQGKYIARMDADDVSLPDRFSKQVEYLESHPDIGILGCGVRHIDRTGKLLSVPPIFSGDLSIRWHILFESPFYHSTIMLRKSIMTQAGIKYDPAQKQAEDFDLWSRLLPYTKGQNLPDILLYYRVHSESTSERNLEVLREKAAEISSETIQRHWSETTIPAGQIGELSRAIIGISPQARRQRAHLIGIYLKIWAEFSCKHQNEAGLSELEHGVMAWAARMILYPPFQSESLGALWHLTKVEWKWPFYLIKNLPYYWARRRIG